MFPLDELEEGDHVGATKVVSRLQAGEEAAPRQSLEVVLADVLKIIGRTDEDVDVTRNWRRFFSAPSFVVRTHQHCCPEVVFVEELRDEDVHLEHVRHVLLFDVAQHVHEPLERALSRRDPQEVNLNESALRWPLK